MDGLAEDDWRRAVTEHATTRGGRQQRSSASLLAPIADRSALAEHLLQQWGFGLISAMQVQTLASLGVLDIRRARGRPPAMLEKLASLGTNGKRSEHVRRDLVAYVQTFLATPSALSVPIPLRILKGPDAGCHLMDQSFLEPHRWFAYLFEQFREEFFARFVGHQGAIENFWRNVREDDPRRVGHPAFSRPDLLTHGIPIAVYGDGVPCTKKGSLDCSGWESLVTDLTDSISKIQFITGYMTNAAVQGDDTLDDTKRAVWKPIVSSLLALEGGAWPFRDWQDEEFGADSLDFLNKGLPLAGGYYCIVWAVKGDTDWKINSLGMPGHWSSANPCLNCQADFSDGPLSIRNIDPNAAWKTTTFHDHADWRAYCHEKDKPVHPLFLPRPEGGLGLSVSMVFGDVLHCVDLGVSLHVCGNVLWHFCFTDLLPGRNPQEKLYRIWAEIDGEYSSQQTSTTLGGLHLHNFCDPASPGSDYPLLKVKAAEARHLVPILSVIWARHCREDIEYEQHISRVLGHLTTFYRRVDWKDERGCHPRYLPNDVVDELQAAIDKCLAHYCFLRGQALAMTPRRLLWNFVPKHHHWWHLGQESRWMSPRLTWTYNNEDWVGHMSLIGGACRHAVIPAKRSGPIVQNYILGSCMRTLFRE